MSNNNDIGSQEGLRGSGLFSVGWSVGHMDRVGLDVTWPPLD